MGFGVLLGIDVGEKTLGIAASDAMRMIASPVCTINRRKFKDDMIEFKKIIDKYQAVGLVVGLPLNMDGSSGRKVQSVKTFASNVARETKLEVKFWDERMSSQVAEKMMLSMDLSRSKRDERIDKLAATYILQGFLDANKE
jgi:putative Holliday junction resolvase